MTTALYFSEDVIAKLIAMQDELNTYIHPEWQAQHFDWELAIVDECMEIHGHLGWKWWKDSYKQGITPDNIQQIKLEVIDIRHFALSSEIMHGGFIQKMGIPQPPQRAMSFEVALQRILSRPWLAPLEAWCNLANAIGMTTDEVLETYTQKYVLNKFRQDHGYKDGSYVKVWQHWMLNANLPTDDAVQLTREDNQVLADIVESFKAEGTPVSNEKLLYTALSVEYSSRLNQ